MKKQIKKDDPKYKYYYGHLPIGYINGEPVYGGGQ